jgi:hypothetical protein
MATGITKRHTRSCRSRGSGRCNCRPSHMAWVWSERDGRKIYKTFRAEAEAKSWRADALSALSKGALRAPKPTTIKQAWEVWYEGAKGGTVRNRSGDTFKPSALRSYERAMRLRILPEFGAVRPADVRRPDLQTFVNGLLTKGLNPSTINVTLLPLRGIFRDAVACGELAVSSMRWAPASCGAGATGAICKPRRGRKADCRRPGFRAHNMGDSHVRRVAAWRAEGATSGGH